MPHTFARLLASIRIHKEEYKRLAILVVLMIWAISKYSTGDKFLGVLVLLCIVFAVLHLYFLIPVTIAAVVLVLFRVPIMNTGLGILDANRKVMENPQQILTYLFSSESGQVALPFEARLAMDFMQAHQVDRYQMSNQIQQDSLLSQRITEGAWPRQIDNASPYLILLIDEETDYPTCMIIEAEEDLALGYCH